MSPQTTSFFISSSERHGLNPAQGIVLSPVSDIWQSNLPFRKGRAAFASARFEDGGPLIDAPELNTGPCELWLPLRGHGDCGEARPQCWL
ncbi:unnamed protein product [Lota lota]